LQVKNFFLHFRYFVGGEVREAHAGFHRFHAKLDFTLFQRPPAIVRNEQRMGGRC